MFVGKILQNITLAEILRLCMAAIFKKQQDRQCTYNVTFRRVRAINVEMEKLHVLHILSICF